MLNQGIKHDEQLAHARGERDLRFFAGCAQTKIEGPQHRVAARYHQRAHVEHLAHLGATTLNRACPKHLGTVVVEWCDSHHSGNLATTQSAELGQMGEQSSDSDDAYCRHATEKLDLLAP